MESSTEILLTEWISDGVLQITLNRPTVHNALNLALITALRATLTERANDPDLRACVIVGAGTQAFSTGADLRERLAMTQDQRTAHTVALAEAADELARLPVPTIAAIRGYALAGGAELALACDLRIASHETKIGFPEVKIGIFPGAGGVVRLPRLVGHGIARELLFTGHPVNAQEALQIGLINHIVDSDQVTEKAKQLAEEIAANGPLAIRGLKAAIHQMDLENETKAHRIINQYRRQLDDTADYLEGLTAFSQRRPPYFKGH